MSNAKELPGAEALYGVAAIESFEGSFPSAIGRVGATLEWIERGALPMREGCATAVLHRMKRRDSELRLATAISMWEFAESATEGGRQVPGATEPPGLARSRAIEGGQQLFST